MNTKALSTAVQARQGAHTRAANEHDARAVAALIEAAKSRGGARGASLDADDAESNVAAARSRVRSSRQS